MSNKKVIVHVGMHKTGTTAIQSFLYRNRSLFKKNGLLYPESGILDVGHHKLVQCLVDEKIFWIDEFDQNAEMEKFRAEIDAWPGDVLVSAENFMRVDRERIKNLFNDYDVEIWIYLRAQVELISSHFQQELKVKDVYRDIDSMLKNSRFMGHFDYELIIDEFQSHFGVNGVKAFVYDRSLFSGGSIVEDFVSKLGVDCQFEKDSGPVNPSLSVESYLLLQAVSATAEGEMAQRDIFVQRMMEVEQSHGLGGSRAKCLLSNEQVEYISNYYKESNARVAARTGVSAESLSRKHLSSIDSLQQKNALSLSARLVTDIWNQAQHFEQLYRDAIGIKQVENSWVRRLFMRFRSLLKA